MAAFEFGNNPQNRNSILQNAPEVEAMHGVPPIPPPPPPPPPQIREESIIALKIYDSCRHRNCLTAQDIGPAKAAVSTILDGHPIAGDEPITPPHGAVSVTAENLRVAKIQILSKTPSTFKKGYWDIDLRYVFEYDLVFRRSDTSIIDVVAGRNFFNKRLALFGSISTDVTISTDLLSGKPEHGKPITLHSDPYILVEAKAVALAADIKRPHCKHNPDDFIVRGHVHITIGLFGIIKLFRIVSLLVESKGFSIAPPCENILPPNPCDFFDGLDFPMDVFSPPQKREFHAGVSENIPQPPSAIRSASIEVCDCGE